MQYNPIGNNASHNEQQELYQQINDYNNDDKLERHTNANLTEESIPLSKLLYKDINAYQTLYKEKVDNYKKEKGLKESNNELDKTDLDTKQYFRKQFIKHVIKHNKPQFIADSDKQKAVKEKKRENNPESATITLKKFLGAKGCELYKLALEEERYSKNFMDAVFKQSTTNCSGFRWKARPVVYVAGPSASGKTTAAKAALEKADQFLPKDYSSTTTNQVVSVDGGIVRAISQMRKLVIQMANKQGYSGISDLHKQSKVLEAVKDQVKAEALDNPKLGVVIPETFVESPILKAKAIKEIDKLPNTMQMCIRVDGVKGRNAFQLFKNVVYYLAIGRAWAKAGFNSKKPIALNAPTTCESKAYSSKGFIPAYLAGILVERWFKYKSKHKLTMVINNDLIVVKPNSHGKLVPAVHGEIGARPVSQRIVNAWNKTLQTSPAQISAIVYHGDLEKFNERLEAFQEENSALKKPLITTSAQVQFAIAKENINKITQELVKSQQKGKKVQSGVQSKAEFLEQISRELKGLDELLKGLEEIKLTTVSTTSILQGLEETELSTADKIKHNTLTEKKIADGLRKGLNEELKKIEEQIKNIKGIITQGITKLENTGQFSFFRDQSKKTLRNTSDTLNQYLTEIQLQQEPEEQSETIKTEK